MPSMLYLDAARMGRMAPTAQLALQDFVRVTGEEGCTLYFERFINDGFSTWPTELQERFPGLRSWGGIAELKATIARTLGLFPKTPNLLAGRSTNLATFAAKWLFEGGRRILITDLTWPSYRKILQREARKSRGSIEFIRIRYSDKPPSIWTSTSPCIQLYGTTSWRVVKSAPLAELVARFTGRGRQSNYALQSSLGR